MRDIILSYAVVVSSNTYVIYTSDVSNMIHMILERIQQ